MREQEEKYITKITEKPEIVKERGGVVLVKKVARLFRVSNSNRGGKKIIIEKKNVLPLPESKYIGTTKAIELSGKSRNTIYKWIKNNFFLSEKVGGVHVIDKNSFLDYLNQ